MSKLIKASFAVLAIGCLAAGLVILYSHRTITADVTPKDVYEARMRMLGTNAHPSEPAVVPAHKGPFRLAIGCLGLPETQSGMVEDMLSAELSQVSACELVDRQSLDKALREAELSYASVTRAKDAIRVGQLLRADWYLLGTSHPVDGSNTIVVRIVDAQSSVIRDVAVFPVRSRDDITKDVADFVRKELDSRHETKPRAFLALGSFVDMGLSSREQDFPQKLRSYLLSEYGNPQSGVTLLEREYVEALLTEIHLDLAGLTDSGKAASQSSMQFAYWLVEGTYQSRETPSPGVDLQLRVDKMFGRRSRSNFQGQPDLPLFSKIKQTIDSTLQQASPYEIPPSRSQEAREQIGTGKEILEMLGFFPSFYGEYHRPSKPSVEARNLAEALAAFRTALLLEPENPEAHLGVGMCLVRTEGSQIEEGRQSLRIAAQSTNAAIVRKAAGELVISLRYENSEEASKWRALAGFGPEIVDEPHLLEQGIARQDFDRAVSNLFEDARCNLGLARHSYQGDNAYGLKNFARKFGTNAAAAAKAVQDILPRMTNEFPSHAPHLIAAAVATQIDSNSPIVKEFLASMEYSADHPETLTNADFYFSNLLESDYFWAQGLNFHPMIIEICRAIEKANDSRSGNTGLIFNDVRMAYAHMAIGQYAEALRILETYGDIPLRLPDNGPWGNRKRTFLPIVPANQCRTNLGRPIVISTNRFKIGDPCLHIHKPYKLAFQTNGLWLATASQLMFLDLDLRTNIVIPLQNSVQASPHALCIGRSNIWIGSDFGLISVSKTTRTCRQMNENDGMLMDTVRALALLGDRLWIGYGKNRAGGLGWMNLATEQFTSLTPDFSQKPADSTSSASGQLIPKTEVTDLYALGPDALILEVGHTLLYKPSTGQLSLIQAPYETLFGQFTQDSGQILSPVYHYFSYDEFCKQLEDSQFRHRHGKYFGQRLTRNGLGIRNETEEPWKVQWIDDLPSTPILIAVDGTDVYLGGESYVALYDLKTHSVRKKAFTPSFEVSALNVAGGFLWISLPGDVYRIPLSSLH